MAPIDHDIEDVLRRHDEAWSHLDLDAISELWDRDFSPVYIGDEYREPVMGWDELSRHFGRVGARLSSARWESRLVALRRPAPELALATLLVSWTLVSVDSNTERHGSSWWSVLMRRTGGGWRFLHQAETPTYLPIDPDELPSVRDATADD